MRRVILVLALISFAGSLAPQPYVSGQVPPAPAPIPAPVPKPGPGPTPAPAPQPNPPSPVPPAPTPAPVPAPDPTPSVTVPASVSGIPGEWLPIPFTVVGGAPEFRVLDVGLVEVDMSAIFGADAVKNAHAKVYKSSQPGTFRIEVRNALNSVLSPVQTVTVSIASPTPPNPPGPPLPNPGPNPPVPAPAPTASSAWFIIVDDMANRTLATAQVVGDLAFWQSIEHRGQNWHVFDKGEAIVSSNGYAGEIAKAKVSLPALLVMDPSRPSGQRVLKCVPLPDEAGISAMVKEITGK